MKAFFEIGQKVVCVDSCGQTHLLEGKTYTIKNIHQCKCGYVRVDVGNDSGGNDCKNCDAAVGACIYFQTRFIPLDFDRQADEEIHQALKGIKIEN